MKKQLIDQTDRYLFERITCLEEGFNGSNGKDLTTVFVHSGTTRLKLANNEGIKDLELSAGKGFIVSPGTEFGFSSPSADFVAYSVSSEVEDGKPIIEIVDSRGERSEVPFLGYKIITNPKRVSKPWGHELWISWFRDFHVMKQIGMIAGNQSSLQFHRKKLETNYLQEGRADVIEGYHLNPLTPEQEVQESSGGIDFDQYKKTMTPGMHWTSQPGTVHRVISTKTYTAYEVSTPELDDVIRLKDDTGRRSGRIEEEHQ